MGNKVDTISSIKEISIRQKNTCDVETLVEYPSTSFFRITNSGDISTPQISFYKNENKFKNDSSFSSINSKKENLILENANLKLRLKKSEVLINTLIYANENSQKKNNKYKEIINLLEKENKYLTEKIERFKKSNNYLMTSNEDKIKVSDENIPKPAKIQNSIPLKNRLTHFRNHSDINNKQMKKKFIEVDTDYNMSIEDSSLFGELKKYNK